MVYNEKKKVPGLKCCEKSKEETAKSPGGQERYHTA